MILAIATFGSVRSANRAARVAERSLLVTLRPVLVPSRPDVDPVERLNFGDTPMISLNPGAALVRDGGDVIYLAIAVRNVGAGLGVLHGWQVWPREQALTTGTASQIQHEDPESFRRQLRDLYISANDTGFWQGALRDPSEEVVEGMKQAIAERRPLDLELLYGDHEGGQRTISRFGLSTEEESGEEWVCGVIRHWSIDGADPR